jgi:hypothetical protein
MFDQSLLISSIPTFENSTKSLSIEVDKRGVFELAKVLCA